MEVDIRTLPYEVLHALLLNLHLRDIGRFAQTCKDLRDVVADSDMWQVLCFHRYKQETILKDSWLETVKIVSLHRFCVVQNQRFFRYHAISKEEEPSINLPDTHDDWVGAAYSGSAYLFSGTNCRVDLIWERSYRCAPVPSTAPRYDVARCDKQIYLAGNRTTLQVYQPERDEWTTPIALPGVLPSGAGREGHQCAMCTIDNNVWLVGGTPRDHHFSKQVRIYDTKSGKWRDGPDLPDAMICSSFVQTPANQYITYLSSQHMNYILTLDLRMQEWSRVDLLLEEYVPLQIAAMIPTYQNQLFLFSSLGSSNHVSCLDCSTGTIERLRWPRPFVRSSSPYRFAAII
eukprot:TRINITY_DN8036_c0_g1_i2.p1 TRINITY_DN8036_c0_g1~~TRINITY_DN8036_c0_g1_i2.p1  ORF type:complete len:345 (+),score=48.92 TRINITY_DN8036_c0_g1_i2:71-1105(+)